MFPVMPRKRSRSEEFMEAFNQGPSIPELMQPFVKKKQESSENEALKRLIGQDLGGIGPDIKKEFIKRFAVDPFKEKQQERLALDSILNRYSKRIGEIDSMLKAGMGTFEERKEQESLRKRLQAERDELLGFKAIHDQEDEKESVKPIDSKQKNKAKTKFDFKNPKHLSRRDKVLKKTGGNKEKAQKILEEEFDLE